MREAKLIGILPCHVVAAQTLLKGTRRCRKQQRNSGRIGRPTGIEVDRIKAAGVPVEESHEAREHASGLVLKSEDLAVVPFSCCDGDHELTAAFVAKNVVCVIGELIGLELVDAFYQVSVRS